MTLEISDHPDHSLTQILKAHLDNTISCSKALNTLFSNLNEPEQYISEVKQLELNGDGLTAEAFCCLETLRYSEVIYITEQLIKRLDDITDGLNNTARLIDICHPRQIENAAHEMLGNLLSMIEILQQSIVDYPNIDLENIKTSCKALKSHEENVDLIYFEWRKKQRRDLVLSLIEENNWTEILGVIEQTTDAAYHAGLLLQRIARYHQK